MKALLLAVALCVAMTVGAYAQTSEVRSTRTQTTTYNTNDPTQHPLELGVQAGMLMPKGDERIDTNMGFVSGRVTYDLTPNVAFGPEIGVISYKDEANGHKYGYIRGVPVMADLILKMPIEATENRLVPYIIGGAGAIIWNYDRTSYAESAGIDVDNKREASFAAKVGGGVDYFVTPQTAIFAEASYLFSEYKPDVTAGSGIAGKYDTNAAMIGAGLKFKI
jgi:opacity protein-like surface antigen